MRHGVVAQKRNEVSGCWSVLLLATLSGGFAAHAAPQAPPPLTMACTAPASIVSGSSISISCTATSAQHRPLTYAFSATAGSLTPHDGMATLSVADVTAAHVTVTATARDDQGASVTQHLTLTIRAFPQIAGGKLAPSKSMPGAAPPPPAAVAVAPPPITAHAAVPPAAVVAVHAQPRHLEHAHEAGPPPTSPSPSASATAAKAVPTPVAPPAVDSEQQAQNWVSSLPYGHITDNIATFPAMRLNQEYTVTVTIGGSNAQVAAPPGQQPVALKVSQYMDVELTSAGRPGDFTIVEADSPENPRMLLPDSTATWHWTVTPKNLGQLQLDVAAYVLYGDNQQNRISYETYNRSVTVKSVTLWGYLKDGVEYVLENPGASLKYMLPGGGGAAIIALIIAWWRRRKNSAASTPEDHGEKPEVKS